MIGYGHLGDSISMERNCVIKAGYKLNSVAVIGNADLGRNLNDCLSADISYHFKGEYVIKLNADRNAERPYGDTAETLFDIRISGTAVKRICLSASGYLLEECLEDVKARIVRIFSAGLSVDTNGGLIRGIEDYFKPSLKKLPEVEVYRSVEGGLVVYNEGYGKEIQKLKGLRIKSLELDRYLKGKVYLRSICLEARFNLRIVVIVEILSVTAEDTELSGSLFYLSVECGASELLFRIFYDIGIRNECAQGSLTAEVYFKVNEDLLKLIVRHCINTIYVIFIKRSLLVYLCYVYDVFLVFLIDNEVIVNVKRVLVKHNVERICLALGHAVYVVLIDLNYAGTEINVA